jgi:hypothetical protein
LQLAILLNIEPAMYCAVDDIAGASISTPSRGTLGSYDKENIN